MKTGYSRIGDGEINFNLSRFSAWMIVFSVIVLGAASARLIVVRYMDLGLADDRFRYFDLDAETSIPTFYTSLLFLICALLMLVIGRMSARTQNDLSRRWLILAIAFIYFSFDEAVAIHERTIEPLRSAFALDGIFHFAWVIPGIVAVLGLGLYMLPLLARVPRRSAAVFALSGAVYVAGALGMEMVGGLIASGGDTLADEYVLVTAIEESLEIAGLTGFLAALVMHLNTVSPGAAIRINAGPAEGRAAGAFEGPV